MAAASTTQSTHRNRPQSHKAAPSNATPINPSLQTTSLSPATGATTSSNTKYYLLGGAAILLVIVGGLVINKKGKVSQEKSTKNKRGTK